VHLQLHVHTCTHYTDGKECSRRRWWSRTRCWHRSWCWPPGRTSRNGGTSEQPLVASQVLYFEPWLARHQQRAL